MARAIEIEGLKCQCSDNVQPTRIAYILYPMNILQGWIDEAARRYSTTIVVVTDMDWQNVFSPWPANGVPKGTPDFKGESPTFLRVLQDEVVVKVEQKLGIAADVERTLVGVSMSGLFTLWQWAVCNTFFNIASLSGSFWYEGFVDWIARQKFSDKKGKAYFLLGDQESKAKAFSSVAEDTDRIIAMLKADGVDVKFESVPGNHYADPIPRLNHAFDAIYQ